tara:strand:+ start:582 stop:1001 length:420 start_codon:yes stop_codon:yes gene_type:complete
MLESILLGGSAALQGLGIIFGGRAARAEQLAKAREMKIQQKLNEINAISNENALARNYEELTESIVTTSVGGESTEALLNANKNNYAMDQSTIARKSLLEGEQLKRSQAGYRQAAGIATTRSLIQLGQVATDTAYKMST